MDEKALHTLITAGENEYVDFKRELDLKPAKNKAEFIKDVMSLANSAKETGYLLIGVDNDKTIIGIDKLEEEQIQQIAYTYITPAIGLKCYLVEVTGSPSVKVGVIEVKATILPHKATRTIEHIHQDDIYIRRGSVISKASPEESHLMYSRHKGKQDEIQDFIKKAETHLRIKHWAAAIRAYTNAIEIFPTAELLLARGAAYEAQANHIEKTTDVENTDWENNPNSPWNLFRLAFEDYSNTLELNPSVEIGKRARFGRFRLASYFEYNKYPLDEREKDFDWWKNHTEGRERGEGIFEFVNNGYLIRTENQLVEKALIALDEAIDLGYAEPEVFFLRSVCHKITYNFGLALRDIDDALSMIASKGNLRVKYLCHKADILVEIKDFDKAYETLSEAWKINRSEVKRLFYPVPLGSEDKILCLFGLQYKFGMYGKLWEPMRTIALLLLMWKGRNPILVIRSRDGKVTPYGNDLRLLSDEHPKIVKPLLSLLDSRVWEVVKADKHSVSLNIHIPTLNEMVNEEDDYSVSISFPDE